MAPIETAGAPESKTRGTSARGLVYERRGAGPPVVMLHGWCLNRRLWMYEEETLSDEYEVITPDLRGFGRSDGLAGPYTLETYAADVSGLVAELELDRPVIVGFAFGGAVAMRVATNLSAEDQTQALRGLAMVGIPSGEYFRADALSSSMRADWPEYCRRSARAICGCTQSDATLAWLTDMFVATPLPVALATAMLLKEFEPTPLAAEVAVPALFVHGKQDDVSPLSVPERCCERAPRGELEVIPDCGHLVHFDRREGFQAVLRRFLTKTMKGSA